MVPRRVGAGQLLATALVVLCACLVVDAGSASADEPRHEIRLASGFDMQVLQYPAAGRRLLIWVPSKYGIRPGNLPFAETVQAAGIDYWLVDLHESYLAPTGRYAYADFDPTHVKELVDHAVAQGWQQIVLGGESRGGTLAMRAARLWQLDNPGDPALQGLLLFHPYLIEGRPRIGSAATFRPIARSTNLPVYIFQPQFNSKYLHSRELVEQLEDGGAAVYFHYLEGVRGGFHLRDADLLTSREAEARARLGRRIRSAMRRLGELPTPRQAASAGHVDGPRGTTGSDPRRMLAPISDAPRRGLSLRNADGEAVGLADYAGDAVLVNFWASWCGPCVAEIASLIRLAGHFEGQPFRVLAVNISESPSEVERFFDELGISPNFDVLFDPDGETARAWRVYAVPSTYLLDRKHEIRYGYRGALRWDKPSVIAKVQAMLDTGAGTPPRAQ